MIEILMICVLDGLDKLEAEFPKREIIERMRELNIIMGILRETMELVYEMPEKLNRQQTLEYVQVIEERAQESLIVTLEPGLHDIEARLNVYLVALNTSIKKDIGLANESKKIIEGIIANDNTEKEVYMGMKEEVEQIIAELNRYDGKLDKMNIIGRN